MPFRAFIYSGNTALLKLILAIVCALTASAKAAVPQAAVDDFVYRLFVSPLPSLLDNDATSITREELERRGVTAEQIHTAIQHLSSKYPHLATKIRKGEQFRSELIKELNSRTEAVLEIDRTATAKPIASLLKFLEDQRKRSDIPLKQREAEQAARQDTLEMIRNTTMSLEDWEARDYYGRRENYWKLQDVRQISKQVNEEDFRLWRENEKRKLMSVITSQHRDALMHALTVDNITLSITVDGKKKVLNLRDFLKRGPTLQEFTATQQPTGDFPLTFGYDERTGEVVVRWENGEPQRVNVEIEGKVVGAEGLDGQPIDVNALSSIRRLHETNPSLAVIRRIMLLNDSLRKQLNGLSTIEKASEVERLLYELQKVSKEFREQRDTTESLFNSKEDREFWGADYTALTYDLHRTDKPGSFLSSLFGKDQFARQRWIAQRLNPFARSTRFSLSGRSLRPGFWNVFVPTLTLASVLTATAHVAHTEGFLDPTYRELERMAEVGAEIASQTWDNLGMREPSPLSPPQGDELGVTANPESPSKTKPIFFYKLPLSGEDDPASRVLEVANQDELDDAKLRPISFAPNANPPDHGIIEGDKSSVAVVDGKMALPLRRGHQVEMILISYWADDEKGGRKYTNQNFYFGQGSNEHFEVLQTEFGHPVIKINSPNVSIDRFSISYQDLQRTESSHVIVPSDLRRALGDLRDAGMHAIADELEKVIDEAEEANVFISPKGIARLLQSNSFYTYYTGKKAPLGSPNNPFREVSQYRDDAGNLCIQCNQARKIVKEILVHGYGPDSGVQLRKASVFLPANNLLDLSYTYGRYHAEVELIDGDGMMEVVDGTPHRPDPRAPEPAKAIFPSLARLGELLPSRSASSKNEARANTNSQTAQIDKPSPPKDELVEHEQTPDVTLKERPTKNEDSQRENLSANKTDTAEELAGDPSRDLKLPPRDGRGREWPTQLFLPPRRPVKEYRTRTAVTGPLDPKPEGSEPESELEITTSPVKETAPKKVRIRITDPQALAAMTTAMKQVLAHPKAKELLGGGNGRSPVELAGNLISLLRAYGENKIELSDLSEAFQRINPENQALEIQTPEQISHAIGEYRKELELKMNAYVRRLRSREVTEFDVLKSEEFRKKILLVFQKAEAGNWTQETEILESEIPARRCRENILLMGAR